jgi:Leucine rich repeat/Leucine rich repeat N-terminal domain
MTRIFRGLEMVSLAAFLIASPFGAAQAPKLPADDPTHLIFLLPPGFHGWACVDFGVAGAPHLAREGDALIIRVRPGEIPETSDRKRESPTSEARVDAEGRRLPLPEDVLAQRQIYEAGTNKTVQRYCVFFGTEDEADAAGDAPGFDRSPEQARTVSPEEREALIALYKATNGDSWNHRFGWLGPPGTECTWHGVTCGDRFGDRKGVNDLDLSENNLAGSIPESFGSLTHLQDLELSDNHLTGRIPESLDRLTHLNHLAIFRNHLSGTLPKAMIERWLGGSLDVHAEDALLTDVSEISLETSAPALLCGWRKITLRSNRSATLMTKRCRNDMPDDRATFCEVKEGKLSLREFARLAWLFERSGFYDLKLDYSRNVTHGGFEITRAARDGKSHEVSNYANAGPFELWIIQTAIEGAEASVEWNKVTMQLDCPANTDAHPAGHE